MGVRYCWSSLQGSVACSPSPILFVGLRQIAQRLIATPSSATHLFPQIQSAYNPNGSKLVFFKPISRICLTVVGLQVLPLVRSRAECPFAAKPLFRTRLRDDLEAFRWYYSLRTAIPMCFSAFTAAITRPSPLQYRASLCFLHAHIYSVSVSL